MTKKIGCVILILVVCGFLGYQALQAASREAGWASVGVDDKAKAAAQVAPVADGVEDSPVAMSDEEVMTQERDAAQAAYDRWLAAGTASESDKLLITKYFFSNQSPDEERNPLDNTGGPDATNYFFVDNVSPDTATFSWIELCDSTGVTDGPTGDDVALSATIGFNFPFYGGSYGTCYVSTNGLISFVASNTAYQASDPQTSTPTNPYIAPLWGDQYALTNGGCSNTGAQWIKWKTIGTPPDQYFVVEWRRNGEYNSASPPVRWFSYEAILYPDGKVKVQFHSDAFTLPQLSGRTWAVGVDAPGAANGVRYWFYNTTGPVSLGITPDAGRAIWFYQFIYDHNFATTSIASPAGYASPNSLVTVTARFTNAGLTTESSPVKYSFNGGPVITEATASLAQNAFEDHTFATQFTAPATPGQYVLTVWTDLATDQALGNDTLRKSITVGGDICTDAITLSGAGPDSVLYNNCGLTDNTPGQPCGASGQDMVFQINVPDGYQLVVWQPTNNSITGRHTLRWGGACPGTNFIDCSTTESRRMRFVNNTGAAETASVTVGITTAPGTCGNLGVAWQLTTCAAETVPFFSGFEGVTSPLLPNCWGVLNAGGGTALWENYTTTPRTGTNCASILGVVAPGNDDWLFSPGIALSVGETYTLEYWRRAASTAVPELLEVKAGLANTPGGMTLTLHAAESFTNITYAARTASFVAPNTGVYYLGWHGMTISSSGRTRIDDVALFQGACLAPNVTVNSTVGLTSVILNATVTGGGGGTPTYQWYTGPTCDFANAILGANSLSYTATIAGVYAFRAYIADSLTCADCDSALAIIANNDECASAFSITPPTPGNPTIVDENNTGATLSCRDTCNLGAVVSAPDIFFSLTLTSCRRITLSLICPTGTPSTDMQVSMFEDGHCCGQPILCNDDLSEFPAIWWETPGQRPSSGLASFIGGELPAGTYLIRASFYSSTNTGPMRLTVYDNGPCGCDVVCQGSDVPEVTEDYYDYTFYNTDPDGGCDNLSPTYDSLNVGETVCGVGFNFLHAGNLYQDTDWYVFSLAQPDTVSWMVNAEFRAHIGIRGVSCPSSFSLQDTAAACTARTLTVPLAAGTYAAYVAPKRTVGNPLPSTYRATLTGTSGCVPDTVTDLTVCRAPGLSNDVILRWTADLSFPGTYKVYRNTFPDVFPGSWVELAAGIPPATAQYVDTGTIGTNVKRFYLVVGVCP